MRWDADLRYNAVEPWRATTEWVQGVFQAGVAFTLAFE
jgi:hypothetical protein